MYPPVLPIGGTFRRDRCRLPGLESRQLIGGSLSNEIERATPDHFDQLRSGRHPFAGVHQDPLHATIERASHVGLFQQPFRRFGRGTGTRRLCRSLVHLLARGDAFREKILLPDRLLFGCCSGRGQGLRIGGKLRCIELYQQLALANPFSDLHRDRFYRDGEVLWWHPDGRRMGGHDWHDGALHSFGLQRGEWLLLLHAGGERRECVLPPDGPFVPELDSTRPDGTPEDPAPLKGGATVTLPARSLLLLRTP